MTEAAQERSESTLRRYAILSYGTLASMFDLALLVLGCLLVGLAVAVLLSGFDLVARAIDLSTGAFLASALVVGVLGMFSLGLAAEGPLGRGRRLVGFELWEVGAGRALASVLVGWGLVVVHGLAIGVVEGLPQPINQAVDGLRAVGTAGLVIVPVLAVPLSILARWGSWDRPWLAELEVPVMFITWAIAAMVLL